MVKEPNRQEKTGMLVILGIVGLVAFSCSAINGGDEPGQTITTTTTPAPITTQTTEEPGDPFNPEIGVPVGTDIPDCDKNHFRAKGYKNTPNHGYRLVCLPDRDADGLADEDDPNPDLNSYVDSDGDGIYDIADDYPNDPGKSLDTGSDSGYSNPFSCGPGDRDGDGDGKCNEG